jgi:hypothetical protein
MRRFARVARGAGLTVLTVALATAGCITGYYRVTDPSSGRVYYTTEISRRDPGIRFRDAKSGADVTLASSEVLEISINDFKQNTAK